MRGEIIAERYRIEEELGQGGMGVVYRAIDIRLGRTVALKMLKQEHAKDALFQVRFRNEARAASALSHWAIATLYDFASSDLGAFLIYEYIDGHTLRSIQAVAPLDLRKLLNIYIAIAEGIQAAHNSGFVHRDLKPENVMIRQDGQVKILDFGLAKALPSAATSDLTNTTGPSLPGLLVGTINYMSPEQLDGEPADRRSDIFSFGTMLYESAAKQHPFEGRTVNSTIGNILKEAPRSVRSWVSGTQPELERVARKCIQKKREERYQSADEILVDLRAILRDVETGGERVNDEASGESGLSDGDFALPVQLASAKVLFLLIQVAYLGVYGATLHWGLNGSILRILFPQDIGRVTLFIVVAAMCGVATRIYLMSAVGWGHPEAGKKFLWLFPWLLLFDGLVWSAAPILLWEKLEWLSLFIVAVMAYLPFAQRTLILTIYPGTHVGKPGVNRP